MVNDYWFGFHRHIYVTGSEKKGPFLAKIATTWKMSKIAKNDDFLASFFSSHCTAMGSQFPEVIVLQFGSVHQVLCVNKKVMTYLTSIGHYSRIFITRKPKMGVFTPPKAPSQNCQKWRVFVSFIFFITPHSNQFIVICPERFRSTKYLPQVIER